jgi:hypothetical protein
MELQNSNLLFKIQDKNGNEIEILLDRNETYATRYEAFAIINNKKFVFSRYNTKRDALNFLEFMNMLIKKPTDITNQDIGEQE